VTVSQTYLNLLRIHIHLASFIRSSPPSESSSSSSSSGSSPPPPPESLSSHCISENPSRVHVATCLSSRPGPTRNPRTGSFLAGCFRLRMCCDECNACTEVGYAEGKPDQWQPSHGATEWPQRSEALASCTLGPIILYVSGPGMIGLLVYVGITTQAKGEAEGRVPSAQAAMRGPRRSRTVACRGDYTGIKQKFIKYK
jgi:hypothetical protein